MPQQLFTAFTTPCTLYPGLRIQAVQPKTGNMHNSVLKGSQICVENKFMNEMTKDEPHSRLVGLCCLTLQ